jgi:hypothetical protein
VICAQALQAIFNVANADSRTITSATARTAQTVRGSALLPSLPGRRRRGIGNAFTAIRHPGHHGYRRSAAH